MPLHEDMPPTEKRPAPEAFDAEVNFSSIETNLKRVPADKPAGLVDVCTEIRQFYVKVSKQPALWCYREKVAEMLKRDGRDIFSSCDILYKESIRKDYLNAKTPAELYAFALRWRGTKHRELELALRELMLLHLNAGEYENAERFLPLLEEAGPLSDFNKYNQYRILMAVGKKREATVVLSSLGDPIIRGQKKTNASIAEEGAALTKLQAEKRNLKATNDNPLVKSLDPRGEGWKTKVSAMESHFQFFPSSCESVEKPVKEAILKQGSVEKQIPSRLAAGYFTTCAVFNGTRVKCIGKGDDEAKTPAEHFFDSPVRDLQMVDTRYCALLENNEVHCVGSTGFLGRAGLANPLPSVRRFETPVLQMSMGVGYFCVLLKGSRDVECEGADLEHIPAKKKFDKKVLSISADTDRTCFVLEGNEVQCIGKGTKERDERAPPKRTYEKSVDKFIVGTVHSFAMLDGGRSFASSMTSHRFPEAQKKRILDVVDGYSVYCLVLEGDEVQCERTDLHLHAKQMRRKFDKKIIQVVVGLTQTCVLLEGGEIVCEGKNEEQEAPKTWTEPPQPPRNLQRLFDCGRYGAGCRERT